MRVKLATKLRDGSVKERVVDAEVVKVNKKTVWVRLADGHVIKRHKEKHIIGD